MIQCAVCVLAVLDDQYAVCVCWQCSMIQCTVCVCWQCSMIQCAVCVCWQCSMIQCAVCVCAGSAKNEVLLLLLFWDRDACAHTMRTHIRV